MLSDHSLVEDLVGNVRLTLQHVQPRLEEEREDSVGVSLEVPPEDPSSHRHVDVRYCRSQDAQESVHPVSIL